eukprot:CAMPEP_0172593806 /NCGR_PEP_ID=MMETSP1068-20121228/13055_1 /TAXON_ID=35684 /ORGANISM="Pseudopedinella elastica, Strain CCMP716" /LENGTH=104 /DNA_ID=CAMNT_0013391489 /DNA_START=142 /DNA_END=456 /DNA_ORIENTATION=-
MQFRSLIALVTVACAAAFTPVPVSRAIAPARVRAAPKMEAVQKPDFQVEVAKALPALAALTAAMPAHAEGMGASFLPPILVPIVGIVFPGLSMALFFIYTQKAQ